MNVHPPTLHPSAFVLAFISEQTPYGMEYLLGEFGSAVLAMSPPKTLPTSLLVSVGNVGETMLMLCQHCLAVAIKLLCCQHLSSYQCQAEHWSAEEKIDCPPPKPDVL